MQFMVPKQAQFKFIQMAVEIDVNTHNIIVSSANFVHMQYTGVWIESLEPNRRPFVFGCCILLVL